MKVEFKAGIIQKLSPEQIVIAAGRTGRKTPPSIEAIKVLAHDIFTNGQEQPVKFRKNDNGDAELVFGSTRLLAIQYINQHLVTDNKKFPLLAQYESMSEQDAFGAAIRENVHRTGVSEDDHGHNINEYKRRYKATDEEVALIYFPGATKGAARADAIRWVKERSVINADLSEDAKADLRTGKLKKTTAVHIAKKVPKAQQKEYIKAHTKKVKGEERVVIPPPAAKKAEAKAKAEGAAPAAAAHAAPPAKNASTIYEAAENMALALDVWRTDATAGPEKAVVTAHDAYRRLVPLKNPQSAESKAA